jgi:hypothetical protein
MNFNKIAFSVFFIITIISTMNANAFDETKYPNDDRLKACDLLMEAEKTYSEDLNNDSLKEAESIVLEAISLVPESLAQLNFKRAEDRIDTNNGRWVQFITVYVDRSCEYYPYALLGKIRMRIPPQPWAKASLFHTEEGSKVHVKLKNTGTTSMQDIKVKIVSDSLPAAPVRQINLIEPGGKDSVEWTTRLDIRQAPFKIEFDEKFGFAPCPLNF